MGLSLSNRQLLIYSLVILLISAVIGSVSLTYPFGRDQGFYAYTGKLFLEGKMNYLHVFDLKPPGSHILFAIEQLIFGKSMFSARIFDILWESLTAFVLFIITFKLTGKKFLSLIPAFLYLLLYYRMDYWHSMQADGFLNLPFALSVLLIISSYERHSFIKIFFAGTLFAIALILKYTVIVFLPLALLSFLISNKEIRSLKFKNAIVLFTGFSFFCIIVLLLYYFTGALKELIDVQFVQSSLYAKIAYDTETKEFIYNQLIRLFGFSVYAPLIFSSFIAFTYLKIKKKLSSPNLLVLFWIIASLLSLIIQWKFYYYHFLAIIAAISVGSVLIFSYLKDTYSSKAKILNIGFIGLFLLYFAYALKPYISNYDSLLSYVSGKETLKELYIKNGITTDSVFMMKKTLNAIEFVNENTVQGDNIYLWGYDPLVYYLSGRDCASRFVYNVPLLWKGENNEFRKEFINAINTANPKLIIIASNDPIYFISGYNEDSKQLLERFSEFKEILNNKYIFKERIDDYDFYELKNW